MAGTIRTGMAGWVFEDWRKGRFYPEGLKQKEELAYASRAVTSIEINSTFYSIQKPESFANWVAQVPEGFRFTVKGHQKITHIKRLKEVAEPVEYFFRSIEALGPHLGAVCWQLPGNARFDADRMESFLGLLPRDIPQAMEVRHESFADADFIALLRAHNVALVVADTAGWPYLDQTADFTYCRLQGAPGADNYTPEQVDAWADRLAGLARAELPEGPYVVPPAGAQPERDVFAFFVSTDKPNAPGNALRVMQRLGIAAPGA